MRELVRTNDPVLISAIEALLKGAGIRIMVLDQNMSVLEGSLGMLPRARPGGRRLRAARRGRCCRTPGSAMSCAPMGTEHVALETSDDAVLGGRLRLRQPLRGHRVGHDAILLAAATGARAGEQAVDLGAGVGAAGLALAVRVAGLEVTLVEIDPALCALAADNARRNGLGDRVRRARARCRPRRSACRPGLAAGERRPRADESAVQRCQPAERLARCAPPARSRGRARYAAALGREPRRGCCGPAACSR